MLWWLDQARKTGGVADEVIRLSSCGMIEKVDHHAVFVDLCGSLGFGLVVVLYS